MKKVYLLEQGDDVKENDLIYIHHQWKCMNVCGLDYYKDDMVRDYNVCPIVREIEEITNEQSR